MSTAALVHVRYGHSYRACMHARSANLHDGARSAPEKFLLIFVKKLCLGTNANNILLVGKKDLMLCIVHVGNTNRQ